MSIQRWDARRDANEGELIDLARKLGAHLWALKTPVDWLCLHRGTWRPVEIKTALGKLSDSQRAFITEADLGGGEVLIWRTREDVMASLGAH